MDSDSDDTVFRYESGSDESESDASNHCVSERESVQEGSDAYFEREIRRAVRSGNALPIWKLGRNIDLNAERECSFLLTSMICEYRNRDKSVTQALLCLGARPTGKDLGRLVPRVYRREVRKKFLTLLLEEGANVNEPFPDEITGKETTSFRLSLAYNNPYIRNLFMKYGGRISSNADLREMVMNHNSGLLRETVNAGWDPLTRHDGLTHLEALCYNTLSCDHTHFLSTVQRLMGYGASLAQRTPEGGPLISYLLYQYGIRKGQLEVVKWFLDHGAGETADWEDRYGDSPLSIAVAGNAESIVRILLDRGVKPDSGNAMKKAIGEVEYHPDSLRLIRPDGPVSERMTSILRGEKVEGPEEIYTRGDMNYR
jgi:hypothetical protein